MRRVCSHRPILMQERGGTPSNSSSPTCIMSGMCGSTGRHRLCLTQLPSCSMYISSTLARAKPRSTNMPAIKDLSTDELIKEHYFWKYRIATAERWGAAVAAAHEFMKDTAREMRRRNLPV